MAITPFTDLPTPTSPDTFSEDADNFINVQLPRFADEVDAIATAFTLNATNSTSTTSIAIGSGTKNYTVQTGKSYLKGMFVIAADDAAPSTNYVYGQVLSYDSGTGALSIDVIDAQGSGTISAWSVSQTASGGVTNAGATFTGDVIVPADVYDSGWNGDNSVPTKNDVYDVLNAAGIGGTLPSFQCRAWVRFDGTGTVAINASGNVSSITDNGTGNYTVNFTTNMPDADFSSLVSFVPNTGGDTMNIVSATVSSVTVKSATNTGSSGSNSELVNVAIFR